MRKSMQIAFILLTMSILPIALTAAIVGSKHDLSTTNFYAGSASSDKVCVWCHTPHNGNDGAIEGPLWNRKITDTGAFVLYGDTAGVPNNASLICLSCHDGIENLGQPSAVHAGDQHNLLNAEDWNSAACTACHGRGQGPSDIYPDKWWTIGPVLTDDHPVSISYADSKSAFPGEFQVAPTGGITLSGGNVECTSCHDPHDGDANMFLRVPNTGSSLCKSCHIK